MTCGAALCDNMRPPAASMFAAMGATDGCWRGEPGTMQSRPHSHRNGVPPRGVWMGRATCAAKPESFVWVANGRVVRELLNIPTVGGAPVKGSHGVFVLGLLELRPLLGISIMGGARRASQSFAPSIVKPCCCLGARVKWTHWGLNPGPSACEADVIPLHHVPL